MPGHSLHRDLPGGGAVFSCGEGYGHGGKGLDHSQELLDFQVKPSYSEEARVSPSSELVQESDACLVVFAFFLGQKTGRLVCSGKVGLAAYFFLLKKLQFWKPKYKNRHIREALHLSEGVSGGSRRRRFPQRFEMRIKNSSLCIYVSLQEPVSGVIIGVYD